MGFMGFGLQKWIYTMRPRKSFSMQRKGSFTSVLSHHRIFKLQPSKSKGDYNLGIPLLIVFIIVVSFMIPKWNTYEDNRLQQAIVLKSSKNNREFNFLLKSGKLRLNSGKIFGAYSEFKLAQAIMPNDKELNALLSETLMLLCFDYNRHCDDLDAL